VLGSWPLASSAQLKFSLKALRKAAYPMHPNVILHEIQQLHSGSDRFESLAEQRSLVQTRRLCAATSMRGSESKPCAVRCFPVR
jgi:hypothetical protein